MDAHNAMQSSHIYNNYTPKDHLFSARTADHRYWASFDLLYFYKKLFFLLSLLPKGYTACPSEVVTNQRFAIAPGMDWSFHRRYQYNLQECVVFFTKICIRYVLYKPFVDFKSYLIVSLKNLQNLWKILHAAKALASDYMALKSKYKRGSLGRFRVISSCLWYVVVVVGWEEEEK